MSKSIRIRTTPNGDENYVKIKLEHDFDLLEILSLKIRQEDAYRNFCSNYGVVAGRVSINDGFGIPNVKVSIFIPITDEDSENPIISELYPYRTSSDTNRNGVRYNLLPKRKQHTDHTPVGTFPEKREVLDDESFIEVYEKYYKYTTKTNESGDFMLFGVPVGQQELFYDLDLSDIGFLSLRPFELIAQGIHESKFESKFKFKSSNDLTDLTQIKSAGIPIVVKPFWCDTLNLGQEIGITRQDIPIKSINLTPTAIFTGSIFSDDEKDSLNKNCRPRKKMGQMNELITGEGKIEIIRRTQTGDIEFYRDLGEDLIDENGNWSFQMPMNLRKVITGEDGTLIPSPDGIKGVATEADVRFRISMNNSGDDGRLRTRAKILVPNMLDNYEFDGFTKEELRDAETAGEPIFKINDELSLAPPSYQDDPANEYNYLENFFTFRWKKVYTIRQYIGRFQPNKNDENKNFIGIKEIADGFGSNKVPFNRVDTNVNVIYLILCFLLTIFGFIVAIINGIINIINSLITMLCQIRIPCGITAFTLKGGIYKFKYRGQKMLGSNSWGDEVEFEMFTTVCYNAKAECDDVGQVTTCTNDLRNCYNAAWYDELLKPINEIPDCVGLNPVDSPTGYRANLTQHVNTQNFNWDNPDAVGRCCQHYSAGWCYNYGSCLTSYNSACRRVAHYADDISNHEGGGNACQKCERCPDCPEGTVKILGTCFGFKYLCLLSPLLCKNCSNDDTDCGGSCCEGEFSCQGGGSGDPCADQSDSNGNECGDGQCCVGCCEKIPLINLKCPPNEPDGPVVSYDPVAIPTPFAAGKCNTNLILPCPTCNGFEWTKIRDWVDCVLEPLASKLGVVQFEFYNDWLNGSLYFPLIKRKLKTKNRRKKIGELKKDKFCDFNCYDNDSNKYLLDPTQINYNNNNNNRLYDKDHGKPDYENIPLPGTGTSIKVNKGGHGHHQNRCNSSFLIEKKEFTKKKNDCINVTADQISDAIQDFLIPDVQQNPDCTTPSSEPLQGCGQGCTTGVKGCNIGCPCPDELSGYNSFLIKHGIIKWYKGNIYYASIIPKNNSPYHNDDYIKGNLFYPTNITELGSSTFCDIDDQPFIIDTLEATTYRISEQEAGKGFINIDAYADLGCKYANCISTKNVVLSSQLGIEIYDFRDNGTDLGLTIDANLNSVVLNKCEIAFDHDDEVRSYFCRRFTTYLNDNMDINYMSPSSNLKNNIYDTYSTVSIPPSLTNNSFFDNDGVNDGDEFIPGDKCIMANNNRGLAGENKYFYALNSGNGAIGMDLKEYPKPETSGPAGFPSFSSGFLDNGNKGVAFHTSHTPYYFYFGLVPGKTALHKTVAKFFLDKVKLPGDTNGNFGNSTGDSNNINNNANNISPNSLLATCLNKS